MGYGNLAYKYDYTEEERQQQRKKAIKKPNNNKAKSKKKTAQLSYAGKIAAVLVVAVSAVFMIVQYVTVNDTKSALNAAVTEYEFEKSVTAQKSFELEQSIDLSKIEAEATSRLGMHRPEKHQIIYLDVKQSDTTVKTAGEVEGFSNRLDGFIKSIKGHIIDFFSI